MFVLLVIGITERRQHGDEMISLIYNILAIMTANILDIMTANILAIMTDQVARSRAATAKN